MLPEQEFGFKALNELFKDMPLEELKISAPKKVLHIDDRHPGFQTIAYKDEKLTVYPIAVKNSVGKECYSYICHPI